MKEKKIQELLDALFDLKYNWKGTGGGYRSEVIHSDGKASVEAIIRAFLLDNRDEKQGVLEAKVFMYEQIISKSNFAPMLENNQIKITTKDVEPQNENL